MEQYKFKSNNGNVIIRGEYTNKAYYKHENDYGKIGAQRIYENATSIYETIIDIINENEKNMLLVGRVQSGKTSNLEMITAIAFDNGYNSVVIFGGYDSVLLSQTTERFKKTFDVSDDSNVHVFSTSDSNELLNIDQDIVDTIVNEDNGKIIFVSMKRVAALSKINSVFNNVDKNDLKTFIIDDEGDQASLNTEFRKMSKSPTYDQITQMKKVLNDPLYLSVTATPQALIFSPKLSRLRPNISRLIHPGNGYTGGESFHIIEGNVFGVEDSTDIIKLGNMPESLKDAIKYYLLASAIMRKRGINSSDMIVHCAKEKFIHNTLYTNIDLFINNIRDNIKYQNDDLVILKNSFKEIFNNNYLFDKEVSSAYNFDDLWNEVLFIISKVYIVMQNSAGKITMSNQSLRKYKIFIGGDLLQRGVTFKRLVTTYFTRWPKTVGNMDTTLQRARWFGYRIDYLDLCKIFCTDEIAFKYSKLTEIDNDLWDQFSAIENNELMLEDIIIDENDTSLRPARGNVTDIETFSFTRKWTNQSVGTYNLDDTLHNNNAFEVLISKLEFKPTSVGRKDEKTSAWISKLDKEDFFEFIKKSKTIFSNHPFNKKNLINSITNDDILILEIFWNPEIHNDGVRERSFNDDMKVSALQQGADTTDINKQKYYGDSHVIADEQAVIIQVFRILPIIKKQQSYERQQYMFSIHFPNKRKAFQWKK